MSAHGCKLQGQLVVAAPEAVAADDLFGPVKRMARLTEAVIVSYSGGKDSAVTLDLSCRYFKTVHAFFMYQVPGLSFQQAAIRWAEARYGLPVYQVPHWELSQFYRSGVFLQPDGNVPAVGITDIYAHVRAVFGADWIAAGERCKDSLVRNAMIKRSGSIDVKRSRFYPLAYWSREQVTRYIAQHKVKVSPESSLLGHSFRSLDGNDLSKLQAHYPDDFARVCAAFPMAEASVFRADHGKN